MKDSSSYDSKTALHYTSYRPPFHAGILEECFKGRYDYEMALDVGCGTGHSCLALTRFCNHIVGLEPSREMLYQSIAHPKIEYTYYNRQCFQFPDDHFDVITFAGSLYYAKSQNLLDEIIRVAKNGAKVIVYDFDILLKSTLMDLGFKEESSEISKYNHQVDFSDLKNDHLRLEGKFDLELSCATTLPNLAHLLLASRGNYKQICKSFGSENVFEALCHKLHDCYESNSRILSGRGYATNYMIEKDRE